MHAAVETSAPVEGVRAAYEASSCSDPGDPVGVAGKGTGSVAPLMGSLIKKRRKRMRKKKHKKMLKRTRWQRRAAGK